MGIPLYTVNTTEGAAFGAAILASVGAGAWHDVPSACAQLVHKVDEVQPQPDAVAIYERLYSTFRTIYPELKGAFTALSDFEVA